MEVAVIGGLHSLSYKRPSWSVTGDTESRRLVRGAGACDHRYGPYWVVFCSWRRIDPAYAQRYRTLNLAIDSSNGGFAVMSGADDQLKQLVERTGEVRQA
jgi:hypothetical protein